MAENVKKFKTFDGVEHDLEDTQARADIADIAANTYTKDEVDSRLTGYAEKADVYDKTESYSKTEVDDALALKANAADVYAKTDTYDKTEVDSALALKANVVDVYSKTETYNKTETDGLLGAKANSADVYTITQTDALLDTKCGIDDSSTTATAMTWSASKLNVDFNGKADSADVYTKAEVDALLEGLGMGILDFANEVLLTSTEYVTTSTGAIIGGIGKDAGSGNNLLINGVLHNSYDANGRCDFISIYGVPSGTSLRLSTDNASWAGLYFVPYI